MAACIGVAGVALLAAVLPAGAHAEIAFSPPTALSGPPAAGPDVAIDGAGNATIVWRELSSDEESVLIRAVRLAPDGSLGPKRTLAAIKGAAGCVCVQVVVDFLGRATVAWLALEGGQMRVQAAQLDSAGVPIGPAKSVSPADEDAWDHDLAVDSQGRVTVVWAVSDPTERIESVRLLPSGAAESPQVISETDLSSTAPDVTVDDEDRAAVVWDSADGIQLVRFDADGSPGALQTLSSPAEVAGAPALVIDSASRATVSWWTADDHEAKAIRIESDGTPGTVQTLSADGEETWPPLLAVDSGDRVTVAWETWTPSEIKTLRIEADGAIGALRLVSDPKRQAVEPQLAIGSGGEAVIAWAHPVVGFIPPTLGECDPGPAFDPASDVVQVAFVGADGLPRPPVSVSSFGQQSTTAALAANPDGRVTVVWHRFEGTYFCEPAEPRLSFSWGPWSPPVQEPPAAPPPGPVLPPEPPPGLSTIKLRGWAVARGRFVLVRARCLGAPGTRCSSKIKLLGPRKKAIASGRFQLAAGGQRVLRLRLSSHGHLLLKRFATRPLRTTIEGPAVSRGTVEIVPRHLRTNRFRRHRWGDSGVSNFERGHS
ncbi:MAG TPA: hypothetical protein VEQ41_02190 [Solirubrobacterales bacterium]|nr:hypothetical protein [Solirubrobacterales bacterium]